MRAIESLKYQARVRAGAILHRAGLYRKLLPIFLPHPAEPLRRLQSYLHHYHEQTTSADADLFLPELGLEFACDIKDHMLWPYLEGQKTIYELTEIEHFRARVRPSDHLLDIGANHGFWGFAVARHAGPEARLYLCEANPTIQRRLARTAQLNPAIAAQVLPYAISDGTTDTLTFYLPADNLSGLGSTVLHAYAEGNGWLSAERKTVVPSRSLDALMDTGVVTGMDLVKIDVEQAEDAVVRGAFRALRRFRPRLLMVETSCASWAAFTLQDMGYDTYCLDETGRQQPVPAAFWGNIFFALPQQT